MISAFLISSTALGTLTPESFASSSTSSKSPFESYSGSIAVSTLLVNLYGLAVEAMIVTVSSFVSSLYLS
jgi:hypothetical protein